QAQREHPEDMWINNSLGWYCWKKYQPPLFDDALRFYSINLALQPHHAAVHGTVAQIWLEKGAVEEAMAEFSKAIELNPKDSVRWNERGYAYFTLRKWDKALADLNKAIELDPKYPNGWNGRGAAYSGLRQLDKALADYNKAVELE